MSTIQFSFASSDDQLDVLELNKSLVPRWFHYENNRIEDENSWEMLSTRERFMHGGPWLSDDTLEVHMKSFKKFGKVLLMWKDSKLVGEIEYHKMSSLEMSGLDSKFDYYHIDWMMVHPKFQYNGFGRRMVAQLVNLIYSDVDQPFALITEPEPGIKEFYEKLGFVSNKPMIRMYQISSLGLSNWNSGIPNLHRYIYGNYDVSNEYTRFQLSVEVNYAKIFNIDDIVTYTDIDDTIRIVKQRSSALSNKYKIIITSTRKLDKDELESLLDQIGLTTTSDETHTIYLPFEFKSDFWELRDAFPKLVKFL